MPGSGTGLGQETKPGEAPCLETQHGWFISKHSLQPLPKPWEEQNTGKLLRWQTRGGSQIRQRSCSLGRVIHAEPRAGSTSAPRAGGTAGSWWDMERSRRRFCPVPPALGTAFVCDSQLCASLAAAWAVQEQRETSRGWVGDVSLRPAQAPLAGTPGSLSRVTQTGCATECAQQGSWHLLCRCFSNSIRRMENSMENS